MLVSAQDTYKVSDLQDWSPWCWGNWVSAQWWGTVGRALTGLIEPSAERAIREVDVNLLCDFSFLPWSSLLVAVSLRGVQPKYKAYYQPNFCIMMCLLAAPVNKSFYQSLSSTYRRYQGILKTIFLFWISEGYCHLNSLQLILLQSVVFVLNALANTFALQHMPLWKSLIPHLWFNPTSAQGNPFLSFQWEQEADIAMPAKFNIK